MSITFYASHNAQFVLGVSGRDLFLLRDYRKVWDRRIEYPNFHIVGVGNNGRVVVKSDLGITVYPPNPSKEGFFLAGYSEKEMEERDFSLAKVLLSYKGDRLCIERVSLRSKLTEKLFKILTSTPKLEKGQVLHELVFYDIDNGTQRVFYKFAVDKRVPHAFSWDISSDFSFMIWGEAQKVFRGMETRFFIADMRTEKVYDQFVLEGFTEWILFANNYGSVLIDSPQKSTTRNLLVANINKKKFKISISNEYKVAHLGKDFIVFQNLLEPKYLFKRFDDSVILEVSLAAIRELNMDHHVIFNGKDDINLIVNRDRDIKVVRSSLDRFPVDARRWQMMAEQQKIDAEIEKKRKILESKEHMLKERREKLRAEQLMRTVVEHKKVRKQEVAVEIRKQMEEIEKELSELRYRFMANLMGKYEYVKQKKVLEEKLEHLREELKKEIGIDVPVVSAKSTTPLPLPTQKITPDVTKILEPSLTDTQEVSLQEELKKYIPQVVKSESPESQEVSPKPKKKKIRRIPFIPKKKKQEEETAKEGVLSSPNPPASLEKTYPKSFGDGFKASSGEDLERGMRASVVKSDEEERLAQIRRQIEIEIQQAVRRKKSGASLKEQLKKYEKLLKELEDSFQSGGISEENYLRLKEKYEKRIEKIKKELSED